MTVRYRQPARLRQLQRLGRQLDQIDNQKNALLEARNKLLLDDQAAEDSSTHDQLAEALGIERSTVSVTLKRLRDRVKS